MDPETDRQDAITAAVEAGRSAGFCNTEPEVLHDSNNVVVWLKPHEIVAKVGPHAHSRERLEREVEVCAQLIAAGAPAAEPLGSLRSAGPRRLPVSLWGRLRPAAPDVVSAGDLASMLAQVHTALRPCSPGLPSYTVDLGRAQMVLQDDDRMGAMAPDDLRLLRSAFDSWYEQTATLVSDHQALHGEPHVANVINTDAGPVLVDFESACTGPVEWDLSAMPPEVADEIEGIDHDLLAMLRLLRSAVVATWCWTRSGIPGMRSHADHHIAVVRIAWSGGQPDIQT